MPPATAILVMGPTASGKSALALALARRFAAEIVSVDSAQVFRDMDVGTAKPDAITRAGVPHHLIDIVSPEESYSAGAFQRDASRLIDEISARGRLPLLVGGTMLYFKALREGLAQLPGADAGVRREIDARAARLGWPALHAELALLDPATAARLAPNDAQRIQRALEIVRLTGKSLDENRARTGRPPLAVRCLAIALLPSDRARLHERIEQRFDEMLAAGLIDEVARLREHYRLDARLPSMRCVGYRQVWSYLEGEYGRDALREKAIAATRQLAKRQLTWLRATPGAEAFDCLSPDLEERVLAYLNSQGIPRPGS